MQRHSPTGNNGGGLPSSIAFAVLAAVEFKGIASLELPALPVFTFFILFKLRVGFIGSSITGSAFGLDEDEDEDDCFLPMVACEVENGSAAAAAVVVCFIYALMKSSLSLYDHRFECCNLILLFAVME
jgi:hypothetical protein